MRGALRRGRVHNPFRRRHPGQEVDVAALDTVPPKQADSPQRAAHYQQQCDAARPSRKAIAHKRYESLSRNNSQTAALYAPKPRYFVVEKVFQREKFQQARPDVEVHFFFGWIWLDWLVQA